MNRIFQLWPKCSNTFNTNINICFVPSRVRRLYWIIIRNEKLLVQSDFIVSALFHSTLFHSKWIHTIVNRIWTQTVMHTTQRITILCVGGKKLSVESSSMYDLQLNLSFVAQSQRHHITICNNIRIVCATLQLRVYMHIDFGSVWFGIPLLYHVYILYDCSKTKSNVSEISWWLKMNSRNMSWTSNSLKIYPWNNLYI